MVFTWRHALIALLPLLGSSAAGQTGPETPEALAARFGAASATELMTAMDGPLARGERGRADPLRSGALSVLLDPRCAHPFYRAPFLRVAKHF